MRKKIGVLALSIIFVGCHAGLVQLDTRFGLAATGVITTQIGSEAQALAMLLQFDGKIILAGECIDGQSAMTVARYLSSGILDETFGTGGIVKTTFADGLLGRNAVLQSTGKIIVVGSAIVNQQPQLAGVRYLSDGTLDDTWGTGGINTCLTYGVIESMDVTPDEKLVCTCTGAQQGKLVSLVTRRSADGELDLTFGGTGDGSVVAILGLSLQTHELLVQSDGKTVIAGGVNSDGKKFCCIRYTAVGLLDETFGTGGIVMTPFPDKIYAHAYALAITVAGKIIVAGKADGCCALVCYNTNGTVDTSFGTDGFVITRVGVESRINALKLQSDGKIVAVGVSDNAFLLVRYNTDGSLDGTFGDAGTIVTAAGSTSEAQDIVLDVDNNILVAGTADGKFALACYRPNNDNFIAIDSPVNNAIVTGNTVLMSGRSSQANMQVRIKINDEIVATTTTDTYGNWSAGASPIFSNAAHVLVADLMDGVSVVSTATSTFTLNGSDVVIVNSPMEGETVFTNKPLVAGQSSRAAARIVLTLDGEAWTETTTDVAGNWQVALDAIVNGSHTLVADLRVEGVLLATTTRIFVSSQSLCDHLRILGGIFTTGNPPIINAGSGNSCPPTCDFTVHKTNANVFNVTFGYPFAYAPIISATAEKARSLSEGFVTIEDAETLAYVVFRLHGRASQIHFSVGSCRG